MGRTLKRIVVLLLLTGALRLHAQQLTLLGLRSSNHAGAFHSLRHDSAGNLYTVFDAGDGVRLLKMSGDGTQLLTQVLLGGPGDSGVGLDLDAAGNIYVVGTSNSLGSVAGTAGTAFPNRAGTRTNSFLAKFSPQLRQQWLTFCGAEPLVITSVAATADAVVVTGSIFAPTLPVTPGVVQQAPAANSNANGFVEKFASAAGLLQYATYLTGANGDTSPAAVAVDISGNAYVAGTTSATEYATTAALVPAFRSRGGSSSSGFVTKLDAAGDAFFFSTFVPGNGLSSIAMDSRGSGSLLLAGDVSPGLFPLTQVQVPIASLLPYQAAIRLSLDGSTVLSSTLLAPATGSIITPAADGSAWVFGSTQNRPVAPLLPVAPVESAGNAFALRVRSAGLVDRAARFGGLPVSNSGYASLPATEGGVAVLADGTVALAGAVSPTLSSDLLTTQTYDLSFVAAPNSLLPSTVRDAIPFTDCAGSACSGSAGFLAKLSPDATAAALALSFDNLPNVTLRNLGVGAADAIQLTAAGYAVVSACGASLPPAAECDLVLNGSGPGAVTIQASNIPAFATALPANSRSAAAVSVVPHELDFGIVTATSAVVTRTLTVQNLGTTTQSFASQNSSSLPGAYSITETGSTCTPSGSGSAKVLAPGGACTITLGLRAGTDAANDGAVNAQWQVGSSEVLLTAYLQAASLSLSAATVDFGRQYPGGLRAGRSLYLSNSSDRSLPHARIAFTSKAFGLTDECPGTLQAHSVCRIALSYEAVNTPSSDAITLNIDGLQATVLGETLPPPSSAGSSININLHVSASSVTFTNSVNVTQVSAETHAVTISNTGALPFTLALAVTGDFADATACPPTLQGGASCSAVLSFAPSAEGVRQGQLSVTAGSGAPAYVALGGTGISILPASAFMLAFGDLPLNTPEIQWLKISQSFPVLQAASSDPSYSVLLVEDLGYGHGEPSANAFRERASASCINCYLGVQFLPLSVGAHAGTLTLTSSVGGSPATISTTGEGVALTGIILTPVSQDLGNVPVGSSSASAVLQLTNGTSDTITVTGLATTGDFSITTEVTGGATCSSASILPGAACFMPVRFSPSATGNRSGTVSVSTSAGQVTSALTGTGSDDPGISFTPGELRFDNVPDPSAHQRSVVIRNTSSASLTVGPPSVSDPHFTAGSNCGAIPAGGTCSIDVTYTAGSSLASGTLSIPVTSSPAGAPIAAQYVVALTGVYAAETAGLQIIPGVHTTVNFGAAAVGLPALSRILHVNNLSGQSMAVSVEMPRQFALTASTCGTVLAGAGCDLAVQYTPLTSGDTTGTLLLSGVPTDGSPKQSGLAYLQGYGQGSGAALSIIGAVSPTGILDFGQVNSGQTSTRILTITNPLDAGAAKTITVRRVRSEFPYLSTSTCGEPLAPGQNCAVTVTYSPVFQSATGSGQTSTQLNIGTLLIESDGANAPQVVDLSGSVTPVFVAVPSNAAPITAFSISQGSLTFTSSAVGTASPAQTVTLTNTGTTTLHISGLVASNGFTVGGSCQTLAVGATCDVTVRYVPQSQAAVIGSLEIRSDSSALLDFVSLLGMPVSTQLPASVAVAPQALDFARVRVGQTASLSIVLTNTGALPVVLGRNVVSGDSSFTLDTADAGSTCGAAGNTLLPSASCNLTVRFTPVAASTLRGVLSVATSATNLPLTVPLSGVGTQPQLVVSPTALNFGNVALGSTGTLAITVANASNLPVDGLRFTLTTGFTASTTCGITTINAGSSCALTVSFAPTSVDPLTGVLTINSTDPASPLLIPLSGNGVQAGSGSQSGLALTPAAFDFGNVSVGSSSTLTAVLRNTGTATISRITFNTPLDFVVSTGCGTALSAGSSCPIAVTYAATAAGVVTGVLTVTSSDSASPLMASLVVASVSAVNGSFTLTANNATSASGTVQQGLPANFALAVTPTGGYRGVIALTCSADQAVQYAACSLLPPSVTLAGTAQNSSAAISTVTAVDLSASSRRVSAVLCLTAPLLLLVVRRRRPAALLLIIFGTVLLSGGCGSGGDPRVRYVAPGTYHFHVTATSTAGVAQAQTVALTIVVTPR